MLIFKNTRVKRKGYDLIYWYPSENKVLLDRVILHNGCSLYKIQKDTLTMYIIANSTQMATQKYSSKQNSSVSSIYVKKIDNKYIRRTILNNPNNYNILNITY